MSYADSVRGTSSGSPPQQPLQDLPLHHVAWLQRNAVFIDLRAVKPSVTKPERNAFLLTDLGLSVPDVIDIFTEPSSLLLRVALKTEDLYTDVLDRLAAGVPWSACDNRLVYGWAPADSLTSVRVSGVSSDMPLQIIREHFQRFGRITRVQRGTDSVFTAAGSGIVFISISLPADVTLPSFVNVTDGSGSIPERLFVHTDATRRRCSRCGHPGHTGQYCRANARAAGAPQALWSTLALPATPPQVPRQEHAAADRRPVPTTPVRQPPAEIPRTPARPPILLNAAWDPPLRPVADPPSATALVAVVSTAPGTSAAIGVAPKVSSTPSVVLVASAPSTIAGAAPGSSTAAGAVSTASSTPSAALGTSTPSRDPSPSFPPLPPPSQATPSIPLAQGSPLLESPPSSLSSAADPPSLSSLFSLSPSPSLPRQSRSRSPRSERSASPSPAGAADADGFQRPKSRKRPPPNGKSGQTSKTTKQKLLDAVSPASQHISDGDSQ
jgi:hypothetical protein